MAQSIKISGLDEFAKDLDQLRDRLPQKRKEAHQRLSRKMLSQVKNALREKAKSSSGKIESFQEGVVGSGGGYAAVRPKSDRYEGYAMGHITNAVENGHAVRKPSGSLKKYRPRGKHKYVIGLAFYQAAGKNLEKMALDEANRIADEIEKELKG